MENGGSYSGHEREAGRPVCGVPKDRACPNTLTPGHEPVPTGKVANANVTLKALRGTKVAMNQQSADELPGPLPSASSLAWVLEQILRLQQQLQQLQLTEQIHLQMHIGPPIPCMQVWQEPTP